MEARSAKVLRSVFDDPRLSITRRTPWELLKHVVPIAARARVPEAAIRALVRPEAALKRLTRFTTEFNATLELPPGASPRARLNHAEGILGAALPEPSGRAPAGGPGLRHARLCRKTPWRRKTLWRGEDGTATAGPAPGEANVELQPVLRGLPNNVTTEMDLELWRLATGDPCRRRVAGRVHRPAACRAGAALRRRRAARRGAGRSGRIPASGTATAPSPRSTSACPAGPTTRPTSWASSPIICGWTTLRSRPTASSPRRRRGGGDKLSGSLPRPVPGAASCRSRPGGAAAGQAFAGLRELPSPARPGAGRGPAATGRGGRRLAAGPDRRGADDMFFLDFAEADQALAVPRCRARGAAAGGLLRGTGAAAHSRACCSPTAPSPRRC